LLNALLAPRLDLADVPTLFLARTAINRGDLCVDVADALSFLYLDAYAYRRLSSDLLRGARKFFFRNGLLRSTVVLSVDANPQGEHHEQDHS
jgi:hypothetical protein